MVTQTLGSFARNVASLPQGVVAILICESGLQAAASARRLAAQGAAAIIAIGAGTAALPQDLSCPVIILDLDPTESQTHTALNDLFDALSGRWVLWLWNAEFFVFPYGENRTLADLATYMGEERRRTVFTYAFDLYADLLPEGDEPPEQAGLCFDATGYHAFPQADQQVRLFGSLGWRFEEMMPSSLQQIGRTSMLRAERGVHLGRDMIFEDPEYASVSCPWHHNLTAAMMTLRRTYRLVAHPNFHTVRRKLDWAGTTEFDWTSSQLLELGMIEPGQWF